jgi:hypothetical protein
VSESINIVKKKQKFAKFEELKDEPKDESLSPVNNNAVAAGTPPKKGARKRAEANMQARR